ncbi:hypothetical protein EZV62_002781 [Acer yangbiense]|uniref:Uncharacterized protein n=1 Tax=Acer yangbiense TaxID=1000413 RepID=A0A5C7J040_9ROSI|nr:hypothetical protein EZV62_002781 [Acer yangbiense]
MKLLEKEFNGKDFFGVCFKKLMWKNNPILPQDSYQRAMARFWARFIDEKILPMVWKANFCEGDERELVIEEVRKHIKILEKELDRKEVALDLWTLLE